MSTIVRRFCDCCKTEFTSSYWDDKPVCITLHMSSPPAQLAESYKIEEVCRTCRNKVHAFLHDLRTQGDSDGD